MDAPRAAREDNTVTFHGDSRSDEYAWLRQKDEARVLDYLKAENAFTDEFMKHNEELEQTLYDEILSHIQETDTSAPVRWGPYEYYTQTVEGQQYGIHCRSLDGVEEILIDENERAEDQAHYGLGMFDVRDDHTLVAFSEDLTGGESYTIRFKDLGTGDLLSDEITGAYYGSAWTNDGTALYYTTHDEAMRPYRLWLHRLGTAQGEDVLVREETDERFFLSVSKTLSRRFINLTLSSAVTSEEWFADADAPGAEFSVIRPRQQEIEYYVTHHEDRFLIWINDTGRNFRLVEAPVSDPSEGNWTELVPHRDEVKIESVFAFKDFVIRYERANALPRMHVTKVASSEEHMIEMPDPVYTAGPGGNAEYETKLFRFGYTSLTTPNTTYDYDVDSRERTLIKQQPVPGGFDAANYESDRIWATAPDGVKVPISLVRRKGTPRDGSAPCWLYGYGSYGAPMPVSFSPARLTLLDRGFVWAVAHIRGGGELGQPWHDDGRLQNKRNTFTDFIASAEHLIADGYTASDRLVIHGGSAGGLLMGAVTNMRPDLFHVVIADVPFVDALNTILDPTLPLTAMEWEEWGNPIESDEVYRYMKSYAPYDNVEAKDYPNILALAGFNDPRVSYWEPAKWVARLRAQKTNDNVLLLKTHMDTGHMGPSGRYHAFRETALIYAFGIDLIQASTGTSERRAESATAPT